MIVRINTDDFKSGLANVKKMAGASYNSADKTWTVDDSEAVSILRNGCGLVPVTVPAGAVETTAAQVADEAKQVRFQRSPVVLVKEHDGQTVHVCFSARRDGSLGVYIGDVIKGYFGSTPDAWPAAVKAIFDEQDWSVIRAGRILLHDDADARAEAAVAYFMGKVAKRAGRAFSASPRPSDYAATHWVGQASMDHPDSIF